jgi:hypothetical protein
LAVWCVLLYALSRITNVATVASAASLEVCCEIACAAPHTSAPTAVKEAKEPLDRIEVEHARLGGGATGGEGGFVDIGRVDGVKVGDGADKANDWQNE